MSGSESTNLELHRDIAQACEDVLAFSRQMSADGLVVGTSGNVSARVGSLIAVTPSGVAYSTMRPEDISIVDMDGQPVRCRYLPSSELELHLEVYRATQTSAVVHTHSPYATAMSMVVSQVAPVHYCMVMLGGSLPVVPYATFGTPELARSVRGAFDTTSTVLLQNHGLVAIGARLGTAYECAVQAEGLCKAYAIAKSIGEPRTLSKAELGDVVVRRRALINQRAVFQAVDALDTYCDECGCQKSNLKA